MKQPPAILVQLVHIEGPLKGEIQEFFLSEIVIGRNPASQLCFPKDLAMVSRRHATIVREGNRFKITDQSSNGTFLNGKQITEAYLRDGDVLMLAEGGPKFSFLTQVVDQPEGAGSPAPLQAPEPPRSVTIPSPPRPVFVPEPPSVPPLFSEAPSVAAVAVQRVKRPLIIQYGPTLRAYNELPVTLGRRGDCDFQLDHPGIDEQHAQIFFHQGAYWIKDLSGKNVLAIDGRPVGLQGALFPDCRLSLTPTGPEFRFLGDGRLAEIESAAPVFEAEAAPVSPAPGNKGGGIMKRFFSK